MWHKYFQNMVMLFCAALFLAACTHVSEEKLTSQQLATADIQDREMVQLQVGKQRLNVEVVTTPASLTQGLSGRDSIGSDGMLFVLPGREQAFFWMKDMKFDLDLVWIDGSSIVTMTEQVPAPSPQSDQQLPSYPSQVPVTHVLEIPAGKAQEYGLQIGDSVTLVSP